MRLKGAGIEGFLARPDPAVRAVLLYGPDQGLVRERADRLAQGVVGDLKHPFRVADLTPAALKADPVLLGDEAAAIAFGGGRRVVRIRDAADALAGTFKEFLADPPGDALILVEAGDLPARSTLRSLFESADKAAALPCYRDEGGGLKEIVRSHLREAALSPSPEAIDWLAGVLGADRGVTRSELNKLVLYMADRGRGATVTLADAQAAVGDSAAAAIDDVLQAAAAGDLKGLDRALTRAAGETTPVGLLRAAQRHMQRLHLVAGEIAAGAAPDAAIRALRPPLFFRAADRFKAALPLWPAGEAARAMARLVEAELACKRTGAPDHAIAAQTLFDMARTAERRRRPGGTRGRLD